MASPTAPVCRKDLRRLTIFLPFNDIETVRRRFARTKGKSRRLFWNRFRRTPGLIPHENIFLQHLREECTDHGALLIFDEVITGFRVGRGGAQELYECDRPDLTALGKLSEAVCRWALSVAEPRSWTNFRRTDPFIRRELCRVIRSPWRRGLRNSGNSKRLMAGQGWKTGRQFQNAMQRPDELNFTSLSPHRLDVLPVFRDGAVRSRGRKTKRPRTVREFFHIAWITAFFSRRHNSRPVFFPPPIPSDLERTATVARAGC